MESLLQSLTGGRAGVPASSSSSSTPTASTAPAVHHIGSINGDGLAPGLPNTASNAAMVEMQQAYRDSQRRGNDEQSRSTVEFYDVDESGQLELLTRNLAWWVEGVNYSAAVAPLAAATDAAAATMLKHINGTVTHGVDDGDEPPSVICYHLMTQMEHDFELRPSDLVTMYLLLKRYHVMLDRHGIDVAPHSPPAQILMSAYVSQALQFDAPLHKSVWLGYVGDVAWSEFLDKMIHFSFLLDFDFTLPVIDFNRCFVELLHLRKWDAPSAGIPPVSVDTTTPAALSVAQQMVSQVGISAYLHSTAPDELMASSSSPPHPGLDAATDKHATDASAAAEVGPPPPLPHLHHQHHLSR